MNMTIQATQMSMYMQIRGRIDKCFPKHAKLKTCLLIAPRLEQEANGELWNC